VIAALSGVKNKFGSQANGAASGPFFIENALSALGESRQCREASLASRVLEWHFVHQKSQTSPSIRGKPSSTLERNLSNGDRCSSQQRESRKIPVPISD